VNERQPFVPLARAQGAPEVQTQHPTAAAAASVSPLWNASLQAGSSSTPIENGNNTSSSVAAERRENMSDE
jgi:hypothetical protein